MTSVVILSYNTRDLTKRCVDAVLASQGVELEVVVIDNGSSDGSAEMIKKEFGRVKLLENKENTGFARGVNQGCQIATGEKIVLLNSDAFVFEDTISQMLKFMEDNPADLVGCKLVYGDGMLQPSFGYFPNLRRIAQMMLFVDNLPWIREWIDSIHVRAERRYLKSQEVNWVTGACVLLKKEVFEKTDGIDERYFMYGEEMEWMYRIKKSGFKIWYTPDAECVHLEGGSSADRGNAITGEMKGWIYWFAKHNAQWEVKIAALLTLTGCVLRMFIKRNSAKAYKAAFSEVKREIFGQ